MEKNILVQLKKEIEKIRKEGKIENLEVKKYNADEAVINEPTNKSMKSSKLKKGLVMGATAITLGATALSSTSTGINMFGNIATVEAASKKKKKDKTKPKFTYKGKTKMTATEDEAIKIPKVTAKDNKDGSVTKKIKVTVKKGKKNYKSIASKIKANKKVTFEEEGTYAITYTVKDKAGNKATKSRYVTVKAATTDKTTQQPYVRVPETTEAPATTETPKTTEAPTGNVNYDYSKFNLKTIEKNGIKYKLTESEDFNAFMFEDDKNYDSNIKIVIENGYMEYATDKNSTLYTDYNYLDLFGKISAYDASGKDISDRIILDVSQINHYLEYSILNVQIFVDDGKGNIFSDSILISIKEGLDKGTVDTSNLLSVGYKQISSSPVIYAKQKVVAKSLSTNKSLVLK